MTEEEMLARLAKELQSMTNVEQKNLFKSDSSLKAWIKKTLKRIASDVIDYVVDKIDEFITYLSENFQRL
jgi:hypothetical protein